MKHSTIAAASALALVANARGFANAETPATTEAAKAKAERIEPVLTGAGKITLPTRTSKRGSESKYPFASLTEVGMAFGVKNKTAANLSSIVSNANRKHQVPVTDENGNAVYDTKEIRGADGTVTNVPDTSKPKMQAGKRFFAFDVTPEYRKANAEAFAKGGTFEGASALVFREQ